MKRSITILEDDKDIREICTYVFTDVGYVVNSFDSVKHFESGKQATNLFLLDIQLPDGNGLQVCEQLKASKEFGHTPIIIMSANLKPANLLTSSADSFIEKPFDIDRLLERVAKLLD